jgi:hypothetical protein
MKEPLDVVPCDRGHVHRTDKRRDVSVDSTAIDRQSGRFFGCLGSRPYSSGHRVLEIKLAELCDGEGFS